MNEEEIIERVKNNYKYFSFKLGEYTIPKYVNGRIDIQQLRNKLLKGRRFGELSFIEDYKATRKLANAEKSGYFYEQFPIIIDDRELWKECCHKNGILGNYYLDGNNNSSLIDNKKIIFPDMYLTYLNKAIEVDYSVDHIDEVDNTRDLYLFLRYNIETIRIKEYKRLGDLEDSKQKKDIYFLLKNTKYVSNKFRNPFDYLPYYVEEFKNRYKLMMSGLVSPNDDYLKHIK